MLRRSAAGAERGDGSSALHHAFYNEDDPRRWGREELPIDPPPQVLSEQGVVLEIGCGNGPMHLPRATAVVGDISLPALRRLHHQRAVQCDAEALPVRSGAVGAYVTVAALEHMPSPHAALVEMHRVLKPGGVVFLAPAWNCRRWTATGVTVRPYGELPLKLRLLKLSLVVRERLWWRASFALVTRLGREARAYSRADFPLEFRPLSPNLADYLVSDSDAWASIDPHAAITFLRTRGYDVVSHRSLWQRLTARHEPVVARKEPSFGPS